MVTYESLLAKHEHIPVIECNLTHAKIEGLCCDGYILIDRDLDPSRKKLVLAEEIAHYETSAGNILDLQDARNRKQEFQARQLVYERLVTLDDLIECKKLGLIENWEVAEHLGVDTEFLSDAIEHYKTKYGLYFRHGEYFFRFEGNCLNIFKFL